MCRAFGGGAGTERDGAALAGREQPLEPGQGSELGTAPAANASARWRTTTCRGLASGMPRSSSLASGQATARLPLRSFGGHAPLRAGARLRRPRPAPPRLHVAPGIVVGIGRFLGSALAFGNLAAPFLFGFRALPA